MLLPKVKPRNFTLIYSDRPSARKYGSLRHWKVRKCLKGWIKDVFTNQWITYWHVAAVWSFHAFELRTWTSSKTRTRVNKAALRIAPSNLLCASFRSWTGTCGCWLSCGCCRCSAPRWALGWVGEGWPAPPSLARSPSWCRTSRECYLWVRNNNTSRSARGSRNNVKEQVHTNWNRSGTRCLVLMLRLLSRGGTTLSETFSS